MSQKIQQEQEKLFNQDPWKVKATKFSQPFYESEMDPTQPGNDRIVALPNYKAFLPISKLCIHSGSNPVVNLPFLSFSDETFRICLGREVCSEMNIIENNRLKPKPLKQVQTI
jgi:hypothetical protein